MKPVPDPNWRPWIYAIAWLGGGIAFTMLSIWTVTLIRWGWPEGTEAQRLSILGIALYMMLTVPILVMIGLGLRNAIRNIKATALGGSVEVSGHDGKENGDG